MLRRVLLVAGLLLLGFGAEPLFYAARNRQQVNITCDAFAQSRPTALWLRVTGCEMDYLGAGFREWGGRIVELYFPARPVGRPRSDPAPIVAATSDPSVLALAEETIGSGRTPDQEQFLVMMLKIVTMLRASREIEGYARGSLLERFSSRSALAGLSSPLAADVVVVDLHTTPRPILPAAAAAAGVVLIGMFVILRSRHRSAAVARSTDTFEEASEPGHFVDAPAGHLTIDAGDRPSPSATRIRVMLLNLPKEAGVEAIEGAPPIGSGADAIAALAHAVPGLQFEASGRALVTGADYSLTVDIGPTDPVYTVVIDARGADAPAIVRRILDATGWRAYDAKRGTFVAPDALDKRTEEDLKEKGEGSISVFQPRITRNTRK